MWWAGVRAYRSHSPVNSWTKVPPRSWCHGVVSQRSLHNAPIFRLLLKVAVNGTHQCDFLNFCGGSGSQQTAYLVILGPCTMHHAPCTMYHVPCQMHHLPCTMYHLPCTMYHLPCHMHHLPCTMYHLPCNVHRINGKKIVYTSRFVRVILAQGPC